MVRDVHTVAWEDCSVYGTQRPFRVLSPEDFQAAAVEKTRTIDIIDFVRSEEIDDRYFETPYYLVPSKGGEHAYALLREAIRESGRIGIAKFILREAQHLSAVEVIKDAIVLSVMRFADEIVEVDSSICRSLMPSASRARDGEVLVKSSPRNDPAIPTITGEPGRSIRELRARRPARSPRSRASRSCRLMERLRGACTGWQG